MNIAYIRQSRPHSGLGFQVRVFETSRLVLSSLGSAWGCVVAWGHAQGPIGGRCHAEVLRIHDGDASSSSSSPYLLSLQVLEGPEPQVE